MQICQIIITVVIAVVAATAFIILALITLYMLFADLMHRTMCWPGLSLSEAIKERWDRCVAYHKRGRSERR